MPVRLVWCHQITLDGCEEPRLWHKSCELGVLPPIDINLNLRNPQYLPSDITNWWQNQMRNQSSLEIKLVPPNSRIARLPTPSSSLLHKVDRTLDRHDWMNFVQHTCI